MSRKVTWRVFWIILLVVLVGMVLVMIFSCIGRFKSGIGWFDSEEVVIFSHKGLFANKEGETCFTWAQVITALGAVVSLCLFFRRLENQERQIDLQTKHQVNERFSTAVDLLGNSQTSARTGSMYILHDIAVGNPEYTDKIIKILCSHIRSHTQDKSYQDKHQTKPSNEVQSAIDLLLKGENHKKLKEKWQSGQLRKPPRNRGFRFKNPLKDIQWSKISDLIRFSGMSSAPEGSKDGNLPIDFRHAYLCGADFKKAQCQGAKFSHAQCQGADFYNAQCQGTDFRDAQCQGAYFNFAQCQGTDFRDAQCQGAYFNFAQCQGAYFNFAQCQRAYFYNAQCQSANFMGTQCQGANFSSTQCQGANLLVAQCQGANLYDTSFQGAAFSVTNFRGACADPAHISLVDRIGQETKISCTFSGKIDESAKESIEKAKEFLSATWYENMQNIIFHNENKEIDYTISEGIITGTLEGSEELKRIIKMLKLIENKDWKGLEELNSQKEN